jgi:hypothetical protein
MFLKDFSMKIGFIAPFASGDGKKRLFLHDIIVEPSVYPSRGRQLT